MELHSADNKLYGVVEGVSYGQHERVDELNSRMSSRHFPDSPLQPNFDPRPISTKYSKFPMINRRKEVKEPVIPYLDYNQSANFNPGSHRAPPNGFLNNIDTETILRNQAFALQRGDGAGQGVYVPSSQSDLYQVRVPGGSQNEQQPHPDLFQQPTFQAEQHSNLQGNKIGRDQFFNHTRVQLRDT
jgi:hypothetical protein